MGRTVTREPSRSVTAISRGRAPASMSARSWWSSDDATPGRALRDMGGDRMAGACVGGPARGAAMDRVLAVGAWARDRDAFRGDSAEASRAELDEAEVDDDHRHEGGQKADGQRGEAEHVSERGVGQRDADRHADCGGDDEGRAGPAVEEGDAAGADREDDQALGRERLDEPAQPKQRRVGVKGPDHDPERGEVEDAADRTEEGS